MQEIPNISQLRTRRGGDNFASVNVLGQHIPGDGYAGIFYWDELSTDADDGIMTVATQFGLSGRWKRATIGKSALVGGDLLQQVLSSSELNQLIQDSSGDVILNKFNVELRDLNDIRVGMIFDPSEEPPPQTYDKATVTRAANGVNKVFEIGLPFFEAPKYANVVPGNLNAVGDFFLSFDISKIIVTYRVAPAAGQLIFHYEARI